MTEPSAVDRIDALLGAAADPQRAAREKSYLESGLEHLGTGVPAVRRVAVAFSRDHHDFGRRDVLAVIDALWSRPVHERRLCAVELLRAFAPVLTAGDLALVERLVRESRTWALVDPLAVHVAGGLVERFPACAGELDRWAADEDRWLRRSSLLALLEPLRRGDGDFDRFAGYADHMLHERDFFVRKAIGWVLRETGKAQPQLVAAWLLPRATRASGITVREAVKYLDADDRAAILCAHGAEPSRSRPMRR